jgi:hypothetical protein
MSLFTLDFILKKEYAFLAWHILLNMIYFHISSSIPFPANGIILFFFKADSIVYTNHIFFIHSSVAGQTPTMIP